MQTDGGLMQPSNAKCTITCGARGRCANTRCTTALDEPGSATAAVAICLRSASRMAALLLYRLTYRVQTGASPLVQRKKSVKCMNSACRCFHRRMKLSKYMELRQLVAPHDGGNPAGRVDTPAIPVLSWEGAGRGESGSSSSMEVYAHVKR